MGKTGWGLFGVVSSTKILNSKEKSHS